MAYGDLMGFVYIWSTVMVTKPGSLAIITLVSGQYIAKILYSDSDEEPPEWVAKTISIFELAVLTLINSISVTCANKTMIVFTSLKALALAMIGVLGLVWIARNVNTEGTPAYKNFHDAFESDGDGSGGDGSASGAAEFGVAVLAGLWSFDGWNNLNIVTEELIDPACVSLGLTSSHLHHAHTQHSHLILNTHTTHCHRQHAVTARTWNHS